MTELLVYCEQARFQIRVPIYRQCCTVSITPSTPSRSGDMITVGRSGAATPSRSGDVKTVGRSGTATPSRSGDVITVGRSETATPSRSGDVITVPEK